MKHIKVTVHKIMLVISLDWIDITFEKTFFLKVATEEVGEKREQKTFICLR
jgi:hypothetical protein